MGNTISSYVGGSNRGKRKLEDDSSNEDEQDSISSSETEPPPLKKSNSVDIHTPRRKDIKSTSKYIYGTLFVKGENSDVTIRALGRDWHLHRHYLKQSPYFSGMLSGSWMESSLDVIHVDIPDNNIDVKALRTAFGCLYKDDIVLKAVDVIGILAAATLFQMDGLINQCVDFMKETIGGSTVVTYLAACQIYLLPELAALCRDWLLHNLMATSNMSLLRDVSENLMPTLISSGDLWVLQVEMDLYTMLKKWIFLRSNPSWEGTRSNLLADADIYFKQCTEQCCYLEKVDGRPYIASFQSLRWQYVINDLASLKLVENDRIIPKPWLDSVYRFQCHQLLHIEQGIDKGPKHVDEAVFLSRSMRCGRILPRDQEFCWRWVGYSYGIDNLITYKNRTISLMRNTSSELNFLGSVSLQSNRYIIVRLNASSINEDGNITATRTSGIKQINLQKNESLVLMNLDETFKFPLYVTISCLLTTPNTSLPVPCLRVTLTSDTCCQTHNASTTGLCTPQTISPADDSDVDSSDDVAWTSVAGTSESFQSADQNTNADTNIRDSLSPQAQSLLEYLRSKSTCISPVAESGS